MANLEQTLFLQPDQFANLEITEANGPEINYMIYADKVVRKVGIPHTVVLNGILAAHEIGRLLGLHADTAYPPLQKALLADYLMTKKPGESRDKLQIVAQAIDEEEDKTSGAISDIRQRRDPTIARFAKAFSLMVNGAPPYTVTADDETRIERNRFVKVAEWLHTGHTRNNIVELFKTASRSDVGTPDELIIDAIIAYFVVEAATRERFSDKITRLMALGYSYEKAGLQLQELDSIEAEWRDHHVDFVEAEWKDIDHALILYKQGWSRHQISVRTGLLSETVDKIIDKLIDQGMPKQLHELVINFAREGLSIYKIASELGISPKKVSTICAYYRSYNLLDPSITGRSDDNQNLRRRQYEIVTRLKQKRVTVSEIAREMAISKQTAQVLVNTLLLVGEIRGDGDWLVLLNNPYLTYADVTDYLSQLGKRLIEKGLKAENTVIITLRDGLASHFRYSSREPFVQALDRHTLPYTQRKLRTKDKNNPTPIIRTLDAERIANILLADPELERFRRRSK